MTLKYNNNNGILKWIASEISVLKKKKISRRTSALVYPYNIKMVSEMIQIYLYILYISAYVCKNTYERS